MRTHLLGALVCTLGLANAFMPSNLHPRTQQRATCMPRPAALSPEEILSQSRDEYLAALPEVPKTMQAEWQYMLVERMEPPTKTAGGLFLPSAQQDPLYVVRVVTFGGGIVGESGVTAPLEGIEPGDIAYIKQPWGIGPRDDTWEGRKFSFVRQNDVLSRIA